jgi:arylsulfatase A-like enzyme
MKKFWMTGAALTIIAPVKLSVQMVQKATPEHPNIIFILADDMGDGDLHCYGNNYIQTPNIDRLAQTGTRFEQAYAGSGISSPSRCTLMTGKNSGKSRIRDNQCPVGGKVGIKISTNGDTTYIHRANLLPQDTTIATVLRTAGYRTCLVNKWHLDGYDPNGCT